MTSRIRLSVRRRACDGNTGFYQKILDDLLQETILVLDLATSRISLSLSVSMPPLPQICAALVRVGK